MSTKGMTLTVLATQLAEAVAKDEAPEEGGFDLGAGLFGTHVSDWLRDVAATLAQPVTPDVCGETCARARLCAVCARGLEPAVKRLTDAEIDTVTDQQWSMWTGAPIYAAHQAFARALETTLAARWGVKLEE